MALFRIDENNKIKKIALKDFKNEKELQRLCEKNLEELFQVRFVETEFPFADEYSGRLDSIGLDYEGNPVIIEYKLDKNSAVISQVLFYMDWLVNHHGDFELAARKKLGNDVKIVWDNPKMILVAQDYNNYDKYAVNQINYDIYLYKYIYYTSGELYLENINVQSNKKYAISKGVNDELQTSNPDRYLKKDYTMEYHMEKANEDVQSLLKELDDYIISISDQIEKRYRKIYIGYRTTRSFVEIEVYKNKLVVYLMTIDYNDPEHLIEDVPASYNYVMNKRINISNEKELQYSFDIIKQSYESTL